jgi:sec-independent protein translocase protein TatB
MLHIGMSEILLIAVAAIVVLGPDRLPDLMRTLGRAYGKIRGASQELRQAFQLEVDRVDAEHRAEEIRRRREALAERRAAESHTGGAARPMQGGEE